MVIRFVWPKSPVFLWYFCIMCKTYDYLTSTYWTLAACVVTTRSRICRNPTDRQFDLKNGTLEIRVCAVIDSPKYEN